MYEKHGMKKLTLIAAAAVTLASGAAFAQGDGGNQVIDANSASPGFYSGQQSTPIQDVQVYALHPQAVARAARMDNVQRTDHLAQTASA